MGSLTAVQVVKVDAPRTCATLEQLAAYAAPLPVTAQTVSPQTSAVSPSWYRMVPTRPTDISSKLAGWLHSLNLQARLMCEVWCSASQHVSSLQRMHRAASAVSSPLNTGTMWGQKTQVYNMRHLAGHAQRRTNKDLARHHRIETDYSPCTAKSQLQSANVLE